MRRAVTRKMKGIYLSKAEISYETAHKAGLRDVYSWHQKVWQCFPDRPNERRDFLTRVDEIDRGFRLLIISVREPRKPDWCPDNSWESKKVADGFFDGDSYAFSLLANPTFKTNGAGGTKIRVPIVRKEDTLDGGTKHPGLLAWIRRKGGQHGFSVDEKSLQIRRGRREGFRAKGKTGCFSGVEFRGTLKVSDCELFKRAVVGGIGSAKAFGFGMLCVARRVDTQTKM